MAKTYQILAEKYESILAEAIVSPSDKAFVNHYVEYFIKAINDEAPHDRNTNGFVSWFIQHKLPKIEWPDYTRDTKGVTEYIDDKVGEYFCKERHVTYKPYYRKVLRDFLREYQAFAIAHSAVLNKNNPGISSEF